MYLGQDIPQPKEENGGIQAIQEDSPFQK